MFFSPYFQHSHVHWLPFLAARGPGQPSHGRRGDGEAANAGAAPTGCPEACPGEASVGQEDFSWGSCLWVLRVSFVRFLILFRNFLFPLPREILFTSVSVCFKQDLEQKMKVVENLQDDFDFNYKTLKSQGGK